MPHLYRAEIVWRCEGDFARARYSRAHLWRFDGGVEVPASASPSVVPLPHSRADAVDPEEAFVAALSSCHMLWFLHLAAEKGWTVESYEDEAEGVMERIAPARQAITRVTLRPHVAFAGGRPAEDAVMAVHHEAHERCFIANSVKSEIAVEPRW